ncbi:hypothetical protein UFOVP645_31 [uncultured Caudovirales phage]|uniref:Uncharacterized protein n=1 Tax=uncultured Caudovirales phage TaxID=2100421 RepID=A0A6J5N8I3_9CAUD|nr:hypothetical protein UFOVP645_31 [uncultured Caudovirales phage]
MSGFLDDIIDLGSSILSGDGIGATFARTAIAGYALSEVTNSITSKDSTSTTTQTDAAKVDPGVRQQADASTENIIPVVYGDAFLGGKVFDAYMTEDSQTMYFALSICEMTGYINSLGVPSRIKFREVYWGGLLCNFSEFTVTSFYDRNTGKTTEIPYGDIEMYFYQGGSAYPVRLNSYDFPGSNVFLDDSPGAAWNRMPPWTTNHCCPYMVFAIVKVKYDKAANITGLGDIKFHMSNTMTAPGDVLYDYMTNTRYGAGISPGDLNT